MIEAVYDSLQRTLNRPLWIITAADGNEHSGLVANWVLPTSIDSARPLVQLGLAPQHFTTDLILRSGGFVAHLPASSQAELTLPFATRSGRNCDKLAGVSCQGILNCGPRIEACAVWLACRVEATLDVGDRQLIWGSVFAGAGPVVGFVPLTEQTFFAAASEENRQEMRRARELDIDLQGPGFDAWWERIQTGASRVEPR